MADILLLEGVGDSLLLEDAFSDLLLEDWAPGPPGGEGPAEGADSGLATVAIFSIGSAAGRDYATITAWEAATGVNLISSNAIVIGECYDDTDFNESVTIAGATTDPGHYRVLRAAKGHEYNTRTGVGVRLFSAASRPLTISEAYFVLTALAVDWTGTGGNHVIRIASQCMLSRVAAISKAINTLQSVACYEITSAVIAFYSLRRCVAIGADADGLGARYGYWHGEAGSTGYLAQCVAYGIRNDAAGSYGVRQSAGTLTCIGVIAARNRTNDFNGTITQSYNISSDATASGTGSYTRLTAAQTFKDAANADFRPIRTSPAVDGGIYLPPPKPHGPILRADGRDRIACHFGNGNGTTAGEISGFNNHGTLNGAAAWTSRQIGPGVVLAGVGDFVAFPAAGGVCRTGPEHTISLWFERTGHAAANMTLWSERGPTNAVYKIVLVDAASPTKLQVFIRKADNTTLLNFTTAGSPVTTNFIHHVVLTDKNGVVTLYVDGTQVHTATYTRVDLGEALTPSVGQLHSTDNQYVGRFYDFRAQTVARDSAEVSRLTAPNPWRHYGGEDPTDIYLTAIPQLSRYDIGAAEYVYEPMPWHDTRHILEFTFSTPIVGAAAATSIAMPLWHAPGSDWYLNLEHCFIDVTSADNVELFWKLGATEFPIVTKAADWQGSMMAHVATQAGAALWARVNRAAGTPTARVLGSGVAKR